MANKTTPTIIGSFEDIGKDVVKQSVSLPADIAGKALESLGLGGTTKNPQAQQTRVGEASAGHSAPDAWDHIDSRREDPNRKAIARAALEALSRRNPNQAPSVYEQKIRDDEEKKKFKLKQAEMDEKNNSLSQMQSQRHKRGDLYGVHNKQRGMEIKNTRQD